MLEIDQVMHLLIIRKHGKGIVEEDNDYHWMTNHGKKLDLNADVFCLYCGEKIINGVKGADAHALIHIKEHNLTAFI